MGLVDKIRFAFSTGTVEKFEPSSQQKEIVDQVAREVVRRRMAAPALLFLETMRPLNYIGAQAMHYFKPIISAILTTEKYSQFAAFLEHRESVDYLCDRLDYYDNIKEDTGSKEKEPETSKNMENVPE